MTVIIPVLDTKQAETRLQLMASYFEDFSEMLVEIAEEALMETQERYDTAIGPDGKPWAPLAKSTLAAKDMRGDPGILIQTGAMKESLHVEPPEPFSIEMGYSDDIGYAAIHQFGGETSGKGVMGHARAGGNSRGSFKAGEKRRTIPARPTLGVSDENLNTIRAKIVAYLQRVFGQA